MMGPEPFRSYGLRRQELVDYTARTLVQRSNWPTAAWIAAASLKCRVWNIGQASGREGLDHPRHFTTVTVALGLMAVYLGSWMVVREDVLFSYLYEALVWRFAAPAIGVLELHPTTRTTGLVCSSTQRDVLFGELLRCRVRGTDHVRAIARPVSAIRPTGHTWPALHLSTFDPKRTSGVQSASL